MKIDQRSRIVDAAFDEWGKTHFANTSLSLVASRLSVTKQAIYRHFANKDALIAEMVRRLVTDYAAITDGFDEALAAADSGSSIELVLTAYVTGYMAFFQTNPNYYMFISMYFAHSRKFEDGQLQSETARQRERLQNALKPLRPGLSDPLWDLVLQHITLTTWLISAIFFWTVEGEKRADSSIDSISYQNHVRRTVSILKDGLLSGSAGNIDFARLEEHFTVAPGELLAPGRIVTAVERAVSENGLENASLERIAHHAGISKSTIYFYFTNKDDMLTQMILHEQSQFTTIWQTKMAATDDFGGRIYGYMITLSSYFSRNSALLSMFEWLRYRRIQPHLSPEKREQLEEPLTFLRRAMEKDGSLGNGLTFSQVAAVLWAIVLWRVFMLRPRCDSDETVRSMRTTYQLLALGIERGMTGKE